MFIVGLIGTLVGFTIGTLFGTFLTCAVVIAGKEADDEDIL